MSSKGGHNVVLVTRAGAGSGIGKATALAFAAAGYSVSLLGNDIEDVAPVAEALRRSGHSALAVKAGISREDDMRSVLDETVSHFWRLDTVVANAGINGVGAPIDDLEPQEWDRIAVNLRATYLTIHASVPHLKAAGGGSIVVVSSINGMRTFTTPGATAYTATKAAQLAIVQQLALEPARHRIRINPVCPGEIETNIDDNASLRGEDKTAIPV